MTDPYGPPVGQWLTPGTPAPAEVRPGAATAVAVLAFVQAGLYLFGALAVVLATVGKDVLATGDVGVPILLVLAACSSAALLLLGGVLLLRGGGRTLLLVTSSVEATLLGLVFLAAAIQGAVAHPGSTSAELLGSVLALALLAGPVLRLVLLTRPQLTAWVADRRQARTGPPLWAAHLGQWVPGPAPSPASVGAVVAVLVPVGVLALGATVALTVGGTSLAVSESSLSHHSSMAPADPPSPGDADHDVRFDGDAQYCQDGDMTACDDLYFETPVGDPYETYGSTCGGRLEESTNGGCVRLFGPVN